MRLAKRKKNRKLFANAERKKTTKKKYRKEKEKFSFFCVHNFRDEELL